MRGFARFDVQAGAIWQGRPAHAGVRPLKLQSDAARARSPRACGGSPSFTKAAQRALGVAPRMRGFAPLFIDRVGGGGGRPAHAGVRPQGRGHVQAGLWSPRACGGSPGPMSRRFSSSSVAPRMRGFARQASDSSPSRSGRPAHAGVRPTAAPRTRRPAGSPRACGGSPIDFGILVEVFGVAPRMRGFAQSDV